jgi:hypothetical protein
MKFFLILFLSCLQNNKLIPTKNISNTFQSKKDDYKYDGFDHRYVNLNKTDQQIILYKIHNYFQNKKILNILKNENISLTTKVFLLNDNSIKKNDIFAGGLMKDFDFEF